MMQRLSLSKGGDILKVKRPWLTKFFGVRRIKRFLVALRKSAREPLVAEASTLAIVVTVILSLAPLSFEFMQHYGLKIDWATLALGIIATYSLWCRKNLGLALNGRMKFTDALKHTHTAFALGCLPLVVIVLTHPQALYRVTETIQSGTHSSTSGTHVSWTSLDLFIMLLKVSLWNGLTEELIYRGCLLSLIRRWRVFRSPIERDMTAVLVSSAIFGMCHIPAWGPLMGFCLFSVGLGLGAGYLAARESLLPLIIYHTFFNFLSLSYSVMTLK